MHLGNTYLATGSLSTPNCQLMLESCEFFQWYEAVGEISLAVNQVSEQGECRALEAETSRQSPAWLVLFFSIPNLAGNGLAVQLGRRSDLPLWHPHTRFLSSETPRLVGPLDVDVLVTGYGSVSGLLPAVPGLTHDAMLIRMVFVA